jgi:tRNA G10  N-methylase Trm11
VWEPVCGSGSMVAALIAGGAYVYATDIVDRGRHQHEVFDFLAPKLPSRCPTDFDGIITNPPFGPRGTLATAFIAAGLARLESKGGFLALLLPMDFDAAKSRIQFFGGCPHFAAKIVLTRRIVRFERSDDVREAPKENSAFYVWSYCPLRVRRPPIILYAPS